MTKYSFNLEETWLEYPSTTDNAVAIIFNGCSHNCTNCHSVGLQVFKPYKETSEELIERVVNMTTDCNTKNIVLLGGDPLFGENILYTKILLNTLGKTHNICIYTGYEISYVKKHNVVGFTFCKCGKYIEELKQIPKKTDDEFVLASTNQEFFDANYNKISEHGILKFKN